MSDSVTAPPGGLSDDAADQEQAMRACLDVKDRDEKQAIERAMADPTVRAFVLTMGYLMPLPSDRARARVLQHVADMCDEHDEQRRAAERQAAHEALVAEESVADE